MNSLPLPPVWVGGSKYILQVISGMRITHEVPAGQEEERELSLSLSQINLLSAVLSLGLVSSSKLHVVVSSTETQQTAQMLLCGWDLVTLYWFIKLPSSKPSCPWHYPTAIIYCCMLRVSYPLYLP
jgi:hypothetical protein